MSKIDEYIETKLDSNRTVGLFSAGCEANREGWPKEEAINKLVLKAVNIDGVEQDRAIQKIEEAYNQYPNEHGIKNRNTKVVVTNTFDDTIIKLSLTPIQVPLTSDAREIQLRKFIETAFKPGDWIRIDNEPILDDKNSGKFLPRTGKQVRYEDIMSAIDTGKIATMFQKNDDYSRGCYVMTNPTNGLLGATKQEDIMDHRHVLVECDHLPLEKQMAALIELNLPITTLTHSGSRSLHALVRIDAGMDYVLFAKRVKFLFRVLHMARIRIDTACKNPNRWTRLPGFKRVERDNNIDAIQYLVGLNMGARTWEEWEAMQIEQMNSIEKPVDISTMETLPELPEMLIDGVLRKGEAMIISAPSKNFKSMLVIQMATALSKGDKWLTFQCKKSRVLYCNLELGNELCFHRVHGTTTAMGMSKNDSLMIQNFRKSSASPDLLIKTLIHNVKEYKIECVIIDPIYYLLGDEISSSEVKKITRAFDMLTETTGVAVVCCHHNNKGNQSANQSTHIDRISGSSVFARWADALMTFHFNAKNVGSPFFTLRGFKTPEPFKMEFDYPLIKVMEKSKDDNPDEDTTKTTSQPRGRKQKITDEDFKTYIDLNPEETAQDIMKHFDVSMSLAYEKIKQFKPESSVVDENYSEYAVI